MSADIPTLPPNGFEPLFRSSPYLDLIGPIYYRPSTQPWNLGLFVAQKHCNQRGQLHGGVISALADVALGYNIAFSDQEPLPVVTVQLSVDFAGGASLGDWLEVQVDVQKAGKQLAFANAYFWLGEERIARASGVFKLVSVR